jgi:hypothetical protein
MELWAGLAELRGKPTCKNFRRFGDGEGAFVWVVAWAESPAAFETNVKVMSEGLDCILYGLENIGLLDTKTENENYPEEFINMRATATRQPQDTVFGPFYTCRSASDIRSTDSRTIESMRL